MAEKKAARAVQLGEVTRKQLQESKKPGKQQNAENS